LFHLCGLSTKIDPNLRILNHWDTIINPVPSSSQVDLFFLTFVTRTSFVIKKTSYFQKLHHRKKSTPLLPSQKCGSTAPQSTPELLPLPRCQNGAPAASRAQAASHQPAALLLPPASPRCGLPDRKPAKERRAILGLGIFVNFTTTWGTTVYIQ
jgi:hypothetical protein